MFPKTLLSHESMLCFERIVSQPQEQSTSEEENSSPTAPQAGDQQEKVQEKVAAAPRCRQCGSHQHVSENCGIFRDETNINTARDEKQSETSADLTDQQAPEPLLQEKAPLLSAEERAGRTEAQRLWLSAVTALSLEDHQDRAISLLSQAIELHPGEPQYYLTRATAHVKAYRFTEALQDFDAASIRDGYEGDVDVFLQVARCRLLLGSPTSALLAVRDALDLDPGDRDALELRRRILDLEGHVGAYKGAVDRKHWRMARSAYGSCLSVYAQEDSDAPTHVRCWGIEMLVVEGCWDEAQKSVDILLRESPDAIEAMILRGLVLFLRADLSDAITQIVAVLKLDPDNQRAKALRTRVREVARLKESGNDAFGKGRWTEAKQAWSDALQIVAEEEEDGCGGIIRTTLLLNRATVYSKLGSFAEGLKDVNASLKLHGTYFKAFLCRARLMVGLELYETAAEDLRAALEHGKSAMSASDLQKVQAELEDAERLAVKERGKEQDHYAVLGLTRTSTAAEIKKAYRTLSLKHHPDKGGVAEKFKIIARAYEVLSDCEQKRAYDAKQQRSGCSTSSPYDYSHDSDSDDDSGYW
ncbi:hypothetical protein C8T65DRAFT_744195 [Cerioporus squamosus]|nr:hypothetical protein C8T65DRAFT_744195 [Cerioporus squamosus]